MIGRRLAHAPGLRRGLTLFEVVVALAIFLVGVTALYQLIQDASYRAVRVNYRAQASLRCQSKLAEVVVGAASIESSGFQSFGDDEAWQWRLVVNEEIEGLYRVMVEVQRELPNGEMIKADLNQLVMAPTMRGSSLDALASGPPLKSEGTTGDSKSTAPTSPTSPSTPSTPSGGAGSSSGGGGGAGMGGGGGAGGAGGGTKSGGARP